MIQNYPEARTKALKRVARQRCFAKEFNKEGTIPWFGATPEDPCYLTEVPYKIYSRELITSETDRATFVGGPTSPASVKKALQAARELGPRKVVIWDLVALDNPNLPAEWSNVNQVFEIKFAGDEPTINQKIALRKGMKSKVRFVYEEECRCDDKDDREKERMRSKVENLLRQLNASAAKAFGTAPGPGGIPMPFPIIP